MLLAFLLLIASPSQPSTASPRKAHMASLVGSSERATFRDSKSRRIGVLLPSGYRSVSCSTVVTIEGVRASLPTLLLAPAESIRISPSPCQVPGVRLREVFDSELLFSISSKPLFQFKTNRGYPVSVYRAPERSALAPVGYFVASVLTGNDHLVATFSPSQRSAAVALLNSVAIDLGR